MEFCLLWSHILCYHPDFYQEEKLLVTAPRDLWVICNKIYLYNSKDFDLVSHNMSICVKIDTTIICGYITHFMIYPIKSP